ncbi:MAG TPA: type II toxin-antitoxin system ParD family antitoxin [Pararobbsia sp.]|jgi:putative addiction module CopG family antidote|nr:type II toxin-antitoxin system ParD family antitoxin [Pararobbsia sp.]
MATERLTVTLTPELLQFIRERTATGDYNSDSEVIRDGLRLLKERDEAVKRWLKNDVVPAYMQLKANPESALTREQSEAKVEERRRQRRSKSKDATA